MTADLSIRTSIRYSPLGDWASTLAGLAPAVTVTERPFLTQTTVWVNPASPAGRAIAAGLGLVWPAASTFTRAQTPFGELEILWLGPDEFLLLSPPDTDDEVRSAITTVAGDGWATLVDVSGQRTTVSLSGPHARDVLAHGCAADLHPDVLPTGSCLTTLLARTGVTLQVLDARTGSFQLLVRSSFAGYLAAWLTDAATEYNRPDGPWESP